jgi:probable F420-dependent oxidoreductase
VADGLKLALFGLHRGGSADPEVLARRARRAEEVGFESLWVGDHIALPHSARYPALEPRLEAVVALAFMAAVTTRVRLAVGVIVLPQRQPVLLAKQLASVDVLSNGRLIVGIGVGYEEAELRALGASLADRGVRTDEYLAAMRTLWGEPQRSFEGRFVSFGDVVQRPRPVQRPCPAVVIGGQSAAAYRRAIVHGNGWHGFDLDLERTAAALGALRQEAAQHHRPAELGDLEITITPHDAIDLDSARRYAQLGVHRLAIKPSTTQGTAIDDLIEHVGVHLVGHV